MNDRFPDPKVCTSLSTGELAHSLNLLSRADIGDEAKGEFLSSLNIRGETSAELAGFVSIILERSVRIQIERDPDSPLLELCGTGGDKAGFLNISTAAMFVAAGAGARVVKHGNRAVSSRCGSADVLEALGINLHLEPETVSTVLQNVGCVFLLASDFHPMIAAMAPLRRLLASKGQTTIFNLLGPLLNPALPEAQLTGIYNAKQLTLYAEAMGMLGRKMAWAVHGEGLHGSEGVDELSITGKSRVVASCHPGASGTPYLQEFTVDPHALGFPKVESPRLLLGGDADSNARRIRSILSGEERGPAYDMILLNAAAALHLAGIGGSLSEAIEIARESVVSGKAIRCLERLREVSNATSY